MPEDQVIEDLVPADEPVVEDGADLTPLDDFDIEQYAAKTVVVKVDGADVRVPLKEALAGYQRQADYTRKTQSLAQQQNDLRIAAALQGALEHDPEGTLALLQQKYGKQPSSAATEPSTPWDSDDLDPRIADMSARLAAFEQQQAQVQLEKEVGRLQSKYGDEFDPTEVVTEALRTGSTSLENTFKSLAFDRVIAKQKSAAEDGKRTDAKREAQAVSGGSSAAAASGGSAPIRSIADAWHESVRELSR